MKLPGIVAARAGRLLVMLVATVALGACAGQMEPAKKMLADVEAAVTAAGADAQQYIPDQVTAVNRRLAELKAAFDKQDYKTVIGAAPALLIEAKGLADAAAAKKKEVLEALGAQWTALAAEVPQQVSAIEARLAAIAKTRKLPAGVSKDAVESAKAGLAEAKSGWNDAKTAFGAGDVQAALAKANGVKAKLEEAAAKLGAGAAAKPAA
ncbi:MAG TPA: hypothetical protein VMU00_07130 [Steroidobacteraceae bacterium]|nr:hypothetical protein [Steroidobacteraceae bacterium]